MLWEIFLAVLLAFLIWKRFSPCAQRACVLVLGDFGRSPRMQYHCLSLVRAGFDVDVVAYGGSEPHSSVRDDPKISLSLLRPLPALIGRLPRLAIYFVKVILQSMQLFYHLYIKLPRASHLLLQNPPAIPCMAVAAFVCKLRGTVFIVDMHNYGHTILSMALPANHPLVKFSIWYEHFFGGMANSAVCVTDAMRHDLNTNWGMVAVTMHDRPPAMFRPLPLDERHCLFMRLSRQFPIFADPDNRPNQTAFTQLGLSGIPEYRSGRPALLVSSTSWTEDEDFGVLLKALTAYEERSKTNRNLPPLICVITGKGPQKQFYLEEIAKLDFTRIQVETPWLEAADYPLLLGSADLGVSLHTSSSGLDLPMKVVDMFGCGLPVLAHDFKCLGELVRHRYNGMAFTSSEELASQLEEVFGDQDQSLLLDFRENLVEFRLQRWEQHWKATVEPLFQNT